MFPHAPQDDKVMRYTYDELNEVTREDNQILNKSITYNYDEGGNILTKAEFPYTTESLETATATKTYNYVYGDSNWKDKLTSYDGKAITYDAIGNPLTYDGYTYTWEAGRQLKVISGNGNTISYKYNDSGIRTQKTIGNVTTKYYLSGDKVTYETNGTDNIHYTYDSSDNLVSMNLNGTEYYYIRNAQSDIIGLIDGNGNQVASYTYDTWGKLISIKDENGNDITNDTSSVGYKNPYRYRGYRYDTETGLYYLNSRYYNPEWGRFINADALAGQVGELLSHNVFAYCQNNVVNMGDPSGFMMVCITDDCGGSSKPSGKKNIALKAAIAGSIAVGDKIAEKVVNRFIKTGKKLSVLDGSKTEFGKGFEAYEYIEKNPLGAFTKKIGKVAGLVTAAYCGGIVINDIIKGEYYSAVLDVASLVIGVGIGIGVSAITGALITASTPVLLAGLIGVIGFGTTVGLSMGVDYFFDKSKDKHYGR